MGSTPEDKPVTIEWSLEEKVDYLIEQVATLTGRVSTLEGEVLPQDPPRDILPE